MIDALTGAAFVLIVFGVGMVSILLLDAADEGRERKRSNREHDQ